MSKWSLRSKRKPTGGILKKNRKKKKIERGSIFLETKIDKRKSKKKRVRGGSYKTKLLSVQNINVADDKGKVRTVKILSVEENTANPHYVRRNIITKGAVVKTEAGLAKVLSRPGQDGIINGRIINEKS